MMLKRLLRRDDKGIGAVEFALVAPVLISFVIGISQMGKLFFANADMKNAMAHGARVASIWPVPPDSAILAAVNERLARTDGLAKSTVLIDRDTDARGNDFIEITMTYQVPLEFIFFDIGPVSLEDSRTVYVQMKSADPAAIDDEEDSSTSTTSTSTTSSGDSSTSTTSSGDSSTSTTSSGDSSTSTTSSGDPSTSTTSAGGTTTSTSATSASSTGGTTSSSSNGNGNGNGNGNSNGNSNHGHGNCNNNC